jgi:hypothetical protein
VDSLLILMVGLASALGLIALGLGGLVLVPGRRATGTRQTTVVNPMHMERR